MAVYTDISFQVECISLCHNYVVHDNWIYSSPGGHHSQQREQTQKPPMQMKNLGMQMVLTGGKNPI